MANVGDLNVTVKVEGLDEAMEKANQLKATLEECQQLIDSLGRPEPEIYITLDGKTINQVRREKGLCPIDGDVADSCLVKAKSCSKR